MTRRLCLAAVAAFAIGYLIAPALPRPVHASAQGATTTAIQTGAGDYMAIASGPLQSIALQGGLLSSQAQVVISLYLGTSANPTQIPLTGEIKLHPGVPVYFARECFPTSQGLGVWLFRSDNTVVVGGFLTYDVL